MYHVPCTHTHRNKARELEDSTFHPEIVDHAYHTQGLLVDDAYDMDYMAVFDSEPYSQQGKYSNITFLKAKLRFFFPNLNPGLLFEVSFF